MAAPISVIQDVKTPRKQVFHRLLPYQLCFSCGQEKKPRHMRFLQNQALQKTYLHLVKQALLIELPRDSNYKICESCILRMQKTIQWRQDASDRLDNLKMKRPSTVLNSQSPLHKKPSTCFGEEHPYSMRTLSEHSREVHEAVTEKQIAACRSIIAPPACPDDSAILSDVKAAQTIPSLVKTIMGNTLIREELTDAFLGEVSVQFEGLCSTEDYGTVLSMSLDDPRLDRVAHLATEELRKRVPLLFKFLVICTPSNDNKEWSLFVIYAMLLYKRSQRMNVLQRLLTASCLRYHAGNELINLLHTFRLTLSLGSKTHFLESLGKMTNRNLVSLLTNHNCKVTVDNIDGRMMANQVRVFSGNQDYHYTHWTILPDRFTDSDLEHLSDRVEPEGKLEPEPSLFYCTLSEDDKIRYYYKVMVARILCDEIDGLKMLKRDVPPVLHHPYSHITDRQSAVFPQDGMPLNRER